MLYLGRGGGEVPAVLPVLPPVKQGSYGYFETSGSIYVRLQQK